MILGGVTVFMGIAAMVDGHSELPERAALNRVSGTLERVVKYTQRRSGSVSYEIEIKSAYSIDGIKVDGELVKLTLPKDQINIVQEGRLRSLIGRPVVALFRDTEAVWELASGPVKIIDYEHTHRQQAEMRAMASAFGPYMAGTGVVVSLIGIVLLLRRRRLAGAGSLGSPSTGASNGGRPTKAEDRSTLAR
jgi:hypothetical protein